MNHNDRRQVIKTEEDLNERLSRPDKLVMEAMSALNGDILILGAAGKMGPSLARLAQRAASDAGGSRSHRG